MNLYKNITESSVDSQSITAKAIHDIIVANMTKEELANANLDKVREVTLNAINELFDSCEEQYRSDEECLTQGLFLSKDELN